jgi:hypothetical protein
VDVRNERANVVCSCAHTITYSVPHGNAHRQANHVADCKPNCKPNIGANAGTNAVVLAGYFPVSGRRMWALRARSFQ